MVVLSLLFLQGLVRTSQGGVWETPDRRVIDKVHVHGKGCKKLKWCLVCGISRNYWEKTETLPKAIHRERQLNLPCLSSSI